MLLRTKREVVGQMTVCSGCCCGAVHPEHNQRSDAGIL